MSRNGTTFARRRGRPWINCTSFSRRPMQLLRSGSDRPTLMKVRANMVPKVVNGSCLYRTYRRVVVGILCFVLRALGHLFARHDNPPEEFVSFFEITLQFVLVRGRVIENWSRTAVSVVYLHDRGSSHCDPRCVTAVIF